MSEAHGKYVSCIVCSKKIEEPHIAMSDEETSRHLCVQCYFEDLVRHLPENVDQEISMSRFGKTSGIQVGYENPQNFASIFKENWE